MNDDYNHYAKYNENELFEQIEGLNKTISYIYNAPYIDAFNLLTSNAPQVTLDHYFASSKNIFISMGIDTKMTKRQSKHLIYLKEKEQISDTLNILGATKMFFDFQEVTLEKEIKNSLNRKQNFEQANLDKTIGVSVAQINAIEKLMEEGRFDTLEESLKETAILRLENPEASLAELAALTKDKISRSGINHRLKKIMELV